MAPKAKNVPAKPQASRPVTRGLGTGRGVVDGRGAGGESSGGRGEASGRGRGRGGASRGGRGRGGASGGGRGPVGDLGGGRGKAIAIGASAGGSGASGGGSGGGFATGGSSGGGRDNGKRPVSSSPPSTSTPSPRVSHTSTGDVSHTSRPILPSQYPPSTQQPIILRRGPPQPRCPSPPSPEHIREEAYEDEEEENDEESPHNAEEEEDAEEPLNNAEQQQQEDAPPPPPGPPPAQADYDQLLEALLQMQGRDQLPWLSPEPLPNRKSIWFDRDEELLGRVIPGIVRHKFDGPWYSWKLLPIDIRELLLRTFASMFYWDLAITGLVRFHLFAIVKVRLRGIVSQAKAGPRKPYWIGDTLWAEMCSHWEEYEVVQKSETNSACRNSDREGLGISRHTASQKSFFRVEQEMEKNLGHPVSHGELFKETHTLENGEFIDKKAKEIYEEYDLQLEEFGEIYREQSGTSSDQSTLRTLTVEQQNDIFLKCAKSDSKGNPYGLGNVGRAARKGKRKVREEDSSSVTEITELRQELALYKRLHKKRDKKLKKMESFMEFMVSTDPRVAAHLQTLSPEEPDEPEEREEPEDPQVNPLDNLCDAIGINRVTAPAATAPTPQNQQP